MNGEKILTVGSVCANSSWAVTVYMFLYTVTASVTLPATRRHCCLKGAVRRKQAVNSISGQEIACLTTLLPNNPLLGLERLAGKQAASITWLAGDTPIGRKLM